MADCPSCGKKIGLLIKIKCKSCGKTYCNECGGHYLAEIGTNQVNDNNGNPHTQHHAVNRKVCKTCLNDLETKVVSEAEKVNPYGYCPTCGLDAAPTKFKLSQTETAKFEYPNETVFNADMLCLEAYCPKCSKVYSKRFLWADGRPYDGSNNWDDPSWFNYSQAKLAESVERIDDAAMFYEKAGFLEKAKQLRIKNKNQVVHHITIDVNKLLDFLRQSNFTIPYKCPSCQATIKINSQRDANRFFLCEYCGTSLQAVDVQNLISGMM